MHVEVLLGSDEHLLAGMQATVFIGILMANMPDFRSFTSLSLIVFDFCLFFVLIELGFFFILERECQTRNVTSCDDKITMIFLPDCDT